MSAHPQFAYDPLLDAMQRIRDLLNEAHEKGITDACSATLATVGYEARPSIRNINVSAVLDLGIAFFAHSDSGKYQQMLTNPNVALCLYWPDLQQQVTIEGHVEPLHNEEADAIWYNRSLESLMLHCTAQQQTLPRSETLQPRLDDRDLPRPAEWVGQIMHPRRIEFFTAAESQGYQRQQYLEGPDRRWHSVSVPG